MKRKSAPVLLDSILGEIRFDGKKLWERTKPAKFGIYEFEVWFDGDIKGPSAAQKALYERARTSWEELNSRIRAQFAEDAHMHGLDPEVIDSLYPTLMLIPRALDGGTILWKIWFDRDEDEVMSYGVQIADWGTMTMFSED